MNKKKLTDEQIIMAYKYCVIDNVDCKDCPCADWGCGVDKKDIFDLINRQKAEIERLTEERKTANKHDLMYWFNAYKECVADYEEYGIKNAELQKQVDELKERAKIDLENEKNWGKIQTKQAVKDTAKEIYGEINDSDILVVQTQEYGEIEVVPLERLQEIIKSKGVEVE